MEKLAVIGCGTMGHSIALSASWAGIQVKMYGLTEHDIEKGLSGISDKLSTLQKSGLITQSQSSQIFNRISGTQSLDFATEDSSFIVECIPEDLNLKKELFKVLDKMCAKEVILATNTSGLSPSRIAEDTQYPERTVATHFWNPAHLVPLVEVLRGKFTNDKTFNRAMNLLKVMNKKPIEVKKEVPGLVGNRLQFALFREAQYLLEEGVASKEDIDAAVTYSIGRRLPITGPLLSADMGGLDIFASISDYLFKDLSNAEEALPILKKLISQHHFGQKNGKGYYAWDEKFSDEMNHKREVELIRFLKEDMNENKIEQ